MTGKIRFWGKVLAVRPRLILTKFDGETTPKPMGHILLMEGTRTIDNNPPVPGKFTVAIGPATLLEKNLSVGDLLRGDAHHLTPEVQDIRADLYRVGVLRVIARAGDMVSGATNHVDSPRTDPPLTSEAIEAASRRVLNEEQLAEGGSCQTCPYGTKVAVVRLSDPRNFRNGQWSYIPACLGPQDCPHYPIEN